MDISESLFVEILKDLCRKQGPQAIVSADKQTITNIARSAILVSQVFQETKEAGEASQAAEKVPTGVPTPNEWQLANQPNVQGHVVVDDNRLVTPSQLEQVAGIPRRLGDGNDRGPY